MVSEMEGNLDQLPLTDTGIWLIKAKHGQQT